MKKAVAILLNVVFSTSTLFSAFVVADYFIRFDYYSMVLCENQDEPEMECNGKCHLTFNQEEEKNQGIPLPQIEEFHVEAFHAQAAFSVHQTFTMRQKPRVFFVQDFTQMAFVNRLLRPPECIVQAT
jgi:hypothetical protein